MRFLRSYLFFVLSFLLVSCVNAEDLGGSFLYGEKYSGSYKIVDALNEDGMKVKRIEFTIKIYKTDEVLSYVVETDDVPRVESSAPGFIYIINNSGGMEGRVKYNYITFFENKISSLGSVERVLHLGKTSSISVEKSLEMSPFSVHDVVEKIFANAPSDLFSKDLSYINSALLVLGGGGYNLNANLLKNRLLENPEIKDDHLFLQALMKSLITSNGKSMRSLSATAERSILRCGWFENSISANASLTDG